MIAQGESGGGSVPVAGKGGHRRVSGGTMIAACVAAGVAHLGTSTMPFQVGALMDGAGLSASAAGSFGFFEIGALSMSMLLISPVIHRFSSAMIALIGVALCVCAHLLLYHVHATLPMLDALGILAGGGYGLVFAAMVASVAKCGSPDRVYAMANGGAIVLIVALMALLPMATVYFGARGVFLGIAAILMITAPAYLGFVGGASAALDRLSLPFRKPGVSSLLAMWTAFSLGTGAVWSFAERIGHSLHLSPQTIGFVLSASTFCGILGTVIAAWVSGRISRLTVILVGLFGTALSCLLLGYASDLSSYAAGVVLYWVFYMFLYSGLLGAAAAIDPTGRVGTAGGGCERMGFACGAPVGGLLVDHFSFGAVGLLGALCCVGMLPFCLPHFRRAFSAE